MDNLLNTLFFIGFPIMCLLRNLVVAIRLYLWGKNNEAKKTAKHMLIVGLCGGIAGNSIASIYYYLNEDESLSSIIGQTPIGFFIGAGYATLLFALFLYIKSKKTNTS